MKRFLILATVAISLCAFPTEAPAQGFLKKLGKAASKLESSMSGQDKSQVKKEDNLVPMPGVTLQVIDVYHDGLGATVDFSVTNTSSNVYDLTFNGTDGLDAWAKSQAVGGDGQARACFVKYMGDKSSMDMITRYRLLPNSTARGSFKIQNLARTVTSLNGISIAGLWQANEDNNNHNFRFTITDPLAITTPANTTHDNVFCTLPWLHVSYDKAERRGNNVFFHFTIQNIGQQAITLRPNMGFVKDCNGKEDYTFGMIINGKELGNYDNVTFEPGQPVKGAFAVASVPTTVTSMDEVLWMLERPEYFIQVQYPAIPAK
ncbi:MAG: hypothetical protein LIP02_13905 [Bacteroidales bacterium]|nr:hypothetical protein [Bacteroidales bacterium]